MDSDERKDVHDRLAFQTMDETQRRRVVQTSMEDAFQRLQEKCAKGVELDAWEALHIGDAIESLRVGVYAAALDSLHLASVEDDGRPNYASWLRVDGTPTLEVLRQRLLLAQREQ